MRSRLTEADAEVPVRARLGTVSSKYDFVKVKVRVKDHYYILSRFLISRVLAVTEVPQAVATKVSLSVKKRLVDDGRLDVRQEELEELVFKSLLEHGYGAKYEKRYRMMTKFHQKRVPLLLLLSGPWRALNSLVVTKLAERLNLPSVVRTDIVYQLVSSLKEGQSKVGDEERASTSVEEASRLVREGIEFDIQKCFSDGKSLIIEGPHLLAGDYMPLVEEKSVVPLDGSGDGATAEREVPNPFEDIQEGKGVVIFFALLPSQRGSAAYNSEKDGNGQRRVAEEKWEHAIHQHAQLLPSSVVVYGDLFDDNKVVDKLHAETLARVERAYYCGANAKRE